MSNLSEKWEVYRCSWADEGKACGIRIPGTEFCDVVSDTNRCECCHHMQLEDAKHIVDLHNASFEVGVPSENTKFQCGVGVEMTPLSRGAEIVDQPPPEDRPGAEPIWGMVIADMDRRYLTRYTADVVRGSISRVIGDMHERDQVGRERYGKPLTADNGRDQLVDAYQEILDASVYTRAAMAEGTLVPEAVYNNLLDSLVTVRRLIDRRAEMVALVGGAG